MKPILLILMLLLFTICAYPQSDTAQPVHLITYGIIDTVLVVGNEKTKESIILREMALKPGAEATVEAVEYDRSRIYSIGLFTSVDLTVLPIDQRNFLIVDVKERWYIIPLPIFGFRDGDPKKPFYGAGLLHNNFRGLNQKLFGSVVFGYNPSLSFQFSDPWIDREHNLYFSGSLSYSRVRNRSAVATIGTENFDELHYDANVSLGKRFSLFTTAGVNLGYQIVEVTTPGPGRTVAPDGIDRFLYATASFSYNTRDLRDYTTQGTLVSLYITKTGFGESPVSFTRFGVDVRRFSPLPLDFTLATRAFGSVVSGSVIPTYARSYFGYGERIRGYFRDVFEGENIAGASVELRWPLLKPRTIIFKAIKLPQEFSVWRFGISLELFADAGTTWFRRTTVFDAFASGYGGGIVFLLPYDVVVRTEYAWNDRGRGQLIFDFRSAF